MADWFAGVDFFSVLPGELPKDAANCAGLRWFTDQTPSRPASGISGQGGLEHQGLLVVQSRSSELLRRL
jgi:hypothetical protein